MFNSQVPAARPQSPEAPSAAQNSVEPGAADVDVDDELYDLALSGDRNALGSRLDSLIRQARSREISSDQLFLQLMQKERYGRTALHTCFRPDRLEPLNALLGHIETAAQEGLLQSGQLGALLLSQNIQGHNALHVFAGSPGPDAENLRCLCDCVLRLLQRKLLPPTNAAYVLLQPGAYQLPMVSGGGTDTGQPEALRVLFDFASGLVKEGAVQASEVLSSISGYSVAVMFEHASVHRIGAFIKGIDGLIAADPHARNFVLRDLVMAGMEKVMAGARDTAQEQSDKDEAEAVKKLVADAKERWFMKDSHQGSSPTD